VHVPPPHLTLPRYIAVVPPSHLKGPLLLYCYLLLFN
jgi:hypothetical protein